jgi:hypothetical protein
MQPPIFVYKMNFNTLNLELPASQTRDCAAIEENQINLEKETSPQQTPSRNCQEPKSIK